MKSRIRRTYFTLLELLVVLFILSFGVVLTGVKLKEAYEEQRFSSECQIVLDQLRLAQDLMLLLDADVAVKLTHDPETKQVNCSVEVEKPLGGAWTKLIERKHTFSSIRSYQFEENRSDPLLLHFSLGVMSQGQLILTEAAKGDQIEEKHQKKMIELLGYPSPIEFAGLASQEIKKKDRIEESQLLYPAEVYEELYPETETNSLAGKKTNSTS